MNTLLILFATTTFGKQKYKIDFNLFLNDKNISSPQIIVEEGKEALMEIGSSEGVTKLNVLAAPTLMDGHNVIFLKSKISYAKNTLAKNFQADPELFVFEGKKAMVEIGDQSGEKFVLYALVKKVR